MLVYPSDSPKALGTTLEKSMSLVQSWPMKDQACSVSIPKFDVSILASSQEQTCVWNCCNLSNTPYREESKHRMSS